MKLEDIGFDTLSEERIKNLSLVSPISNCEIVLTSACNAHCDNHPCIGISNLYRGNLQRSDARQLVLKCAEREVKNLKFTGGEPTLWNSSLVDLVKVAKDQGIPKISLSTNGYASLPQYMELFEAGVDNFSISLNNCSKTLEITKTPKKIINVIKGLTQVTNVSVGILLTKANIKTFSETISFIDSLNVSDIRVTPTAMWNDIEEFKKIKIEKSFLDKYPFLNYRITNFNKGRNIRGLRRRDTKKCWLMLDDVFIMNCLHYPCFIWAREGGPSLGHFFDNSSLVFRKQRLTYLNSFSTHFRKICRENCLDFCIDYNNRAQRLKGNYDFLKDHSTISHDWPAIQEIRFNHQPPIDSYSEFSRQVARSLRVSSPNRVTFDTSLEE
jgi:MoaA/NifB/PqqE/SkfB family radical SAM enzyme